MDLNGQTSLKFEVYRLAIFGRAPAFRRSVLIRQTAPVRSQPWICGLRRRRGRAIRYNAPPTCHFGFRCYRSRIVLLIQQNSFLSRGVVECFIFEQYYPVFVKLYLVLFLVAFNCLSGIPAFSQWEQTGGPINGQVLNITSIDGIAVCKWSERRNLPF